MSRLKELYEQEEDTPFEEFNKTSKSLTLNVSFTIDTGFWSSGCLNVNLHSKEVEIEILCFGIYISKA